MTRLLAGLALITLTTGTALTVTNAEAFTKGRTEGFNVTGFEPYERTSSPTWSPSWTPTWSPNPGPPEWSPTPAETYTAYPEYHGCLSASEVGALAAGAGFPADLVPTMVTIAARESGLCPGATNPVSGACGLWQIYPAMPGCTDPERNAAYAYSKYVNAGYSLSPWAMTAP